MDVIYATPVSFSSLNPNAPMFVPMSYRTVEDFSQEWWALVHSSPWFRDYWLQERFHDDSEYDVIDDDIYDFEFDDDDFFDDCLDQINTIAVTEIKKEDEEKSMVKFGSSKWNGRGLDQVSRYAEKAPKIVNIKISPRTIQQPR